MNLPASATDFLDVFSGLAVSYPGAFPYPIRHVRVHVHAFSKDPDDPVLDIARRLVISDG